MTIPQINLNHERKSSPAEINQPTVSQQETQIFYRQHQISSTATDKNSIKEAKVLPHNEATDLAGYFTSLITGCSALLQSIFPDPEWVKDKFDLSVKNIFNRLPETYLLADHLFLKNDELGKLVEKIFTDNHYESDPRTNHATLITNLRMVLTSPVFKTALENTKLENNPNPPKHNQLVRIVLEICRIRFEEGYFFDFFNETMNELGLREDQEVRLNDQDFKKLNNLKSEHKMSAPEVLFGKAQGHFNVNFDPNIKDNIPYVIGSLNVNGKDIKLLRIGTPTIQGFLNNAEIIPEFKGYLETLRQQGKNYLYISLQNDQPKLPGMGDETERNRVIKDLQNDYKHFFVVILAQDSRFYKQLDKDKNPIGPQQSDVFLDNFYNEMMGQGTGFYFPQEWKNDPVFSNNLRDLLKFVHLVIFNDADYQSKELSRAERLDFIEIFYSYLSVYLMHYSKADCANASCKDAIDRGGKLNSLILQLFLTMAGKAKDAFYQRVHQVFTHMPAMWTKGRAILPGRRDRLIWSYDRMHEKMERIQQHKLFVFDPGANSHISLIDSQQAIRFECDLIKI